MIRNGKVVSLGPRKAPMRKEDCRDSRKHSEGCSPNTILSTESNDTENDTEGSNW